MKAALIALLPALVLAGCAHKLTLDEAQEQCMKKGGMLMMIYTQEITASGPGPQIASPGNCVLASRFDPPPAVTPDKAPDTAPDKTPGTPP
ncbi:MAG: hypothetical protein ABI608_06765 [Rhizomicrobium sp.]